MSSTQPFHWEDDDLDDDDFQIHGNTLLYVIVLFSIILVLVFFYYFCTRSRWAINGTRSSSANPVNLVPSSSSQPTRGLDANTINGLPITIHQAGIANDQSKTSECSICLGVFEQGEKVKVLPSCCHCYHCECVDKWLVTHSSCPICRTCVRVDSPV